MQFKNRVWIVLGVAALLGPAGTASAQAAAQEGPIGYLVPELHKRQLEELKDRADIVKRIEKERPFYEARDVSHVAKGVALRGRVSGYVQLRGVPPKSSVVRSFVFWNVSDQEKKASDNAPLLFNGNLVLGRKTADNTDPCWSRAGNHSYVADVTEYTSQRGGPNQDYQVVLPFNDASNTSGENPWAASNTAKVLLEGASLVVIYKNDSTRGPLYLFAPSGDNMFFSTATYYLRTPGTGNGLFTSIGADGQRGGGHTNSASNELTFFDGNQIAGPPVAASDWDGSDGLTLPQLWDTHTHVVKLENFASRVDYEAGFDCLVPVAFVLDQE